MSERMVLIGRGERTIGWVEQSLWEKIRRFQEPLPDITDPRVADAAMWLAVHPDQRWPGGEIPAEARTIADIVRKRVELPAKPTTVWEFTALVAGGDRALCVVLLGDMSPADELLREMPPETSLRLASLEHTLKEATADPDKGRFGR